MSGAGKSRRNIAQDDDMYDDVGGDGDYGNDDDYEDGELIDATYDDVVAEVGNAFSEDEIVTALRKANYDPDAAVVRLLQLEAERKKKKQQKAASTKGGVPGAAKPPHANAGPKAAAVLPSASTFPPSVFTAVLAPAPSPSLTPLPVPDAPADVIAASRPDAPPALSLVVVGHVDAGKSTLLGRLLADTGAVAPRTLSRYARESRAAGKASFAYAWVMDDGETERERGVTVDVGTRFFNAHGVAFTLLDAPGHRDFVPAMLSGVSAADVAVLVIDARPGEFEAGWSAQGQTREHATLCRSAGITQLVVAVNKLDAVGWERGRFEGIRDTLLPCLLSIGFKREAVRFVPVSGLSGVNLARSPLEELDACLRGEIGSAADRLQGRGSDSRRSGRAMGRREGEGASIAELDAMASDLGIGTGIDAGRRGSSVEEEDGGEGEVEDDDGGGSTATGTCTNTSVVSSVVPIAGAQASIAELRALLAWYDPCSPECPTLLQAVARLRAPPRAASTIGKPLRLVVSDTFRSSIQGLTVTGRVEGGWLCPQARVVPQPCGPGVCASVKAMCVGGAVVRAAVAGDFVEVSLGGIEDGLVRPGQVLTWPTHPMPVTRKIKATLATLPSLDMPIVAGQHVTLHSAGWAEQGIITRLLRTIGGDGHTATVQPRLVGKGATAVVRIRLARHVCMEPFAENKRLGRFVLRYSGRTVAVGMVLKCRAES